MRNMKLFKKDGTEINYKTEVWPVFKREIDPEGNIPPLTKTEKKRLYEGYLRYDIAEENKKPKPDYGKAIEKAVWDFIKESPFL